MPNGLRLNPFWRQWTYWFLQAISLLHTYEKREADIAAGKTGKVASAMSAKRVAVLSLTLAYQRWVPEVEKGFLLAAKFLRKECFFTSRDLPYRVQLVGRLPPDLV